METIEEAEALLEKGWPSIIEECRAVLGGELHYQAVVYHCLRQAGVPRSQIGMNVKQWIADPKTELFKTFDLLKHANFQGGFEPIPDVVLFDPGIQSDWRRRNWMATLKHMLLAIEIKASERARGRLSANEIVKDILKLVAHRDEIKHRGSNMKPVMMVIDTAPEQCEQMRPAAVALAMETAKANGVRFLYVSQEREINQA